MNAPKPRHVIFHLAGDMFFHARNMNHAIVSNYIVLIFILSLQGSKKFTTSVDNVVFDLTTLNS